MKKLQETARRIAAEHCHPSRLAGGVEAIAKALVESEAAGYQRGLQYAMSELQGRLARSGAIQMQPEFRLGQSVKTP